MLSPARCRVLLAGLAGAALLILVAPVGFAQDRPGATGVRRMVLTGTATYRERMALPAGAVFEATLEEVSRADAPAQVIGRARITRPGQVPIRFEISYDPRQIVRTRSYTVRATIRDGGRLLFTSDQATPVITRGHDDEVAILMRRPSRAPGGEPRAPVLAPLPATFMGLLPCTDCRGIRYEITLMSDGAYMRRMSYLRPGHDQSFHEIGRWALSTDLRTLTLDGGHEATYWRLEDSNTLRKLDREGNAIVSNLRQDLTRQPSVRPMEPRVRLRGMFRYMADAARFRDCVSGLEWPVATRDDYADLERAYTRQRRAPGAELMVSLEGRIESLPGMEGDRVEPTLVVESFVSASPGAGCPERQAQQELANTRWRPVQLNGRPVVVTSPQREPWIVFEPRELRFSGSGGCNRISGPYRAASGGRLSLGPVISTKMACLNVTYEDEFLRALDETATFRIAGRFLELFDAGGTRIARLEERNLR